MRSGQRMSLKVPLDIDGSTISANEHCLISGLI